DSFCHVVIVPLKTKRRLERPRFGTRIKAHVLDLRLFARLRQLWHEERGLLHFLFSVSIENVRFNLFVSVRRIKGVSCTAQCFKTPKTKTGELPLHGQEESLGLIANNIHIRPVIVVLVYIRKM